MCEGWKGGCGGAQPPVPQFPPRAADEAVAAIGERQRTTGGQIPPAGELTQQRSAGLLKGVGGDRWERGPAGLCCGPRTRRRLGAPGGPAAGAARAVWAGGPGCTWVAPSMVVASRSGYGWPVHVWKEKGVMR